MKSFFFPLLVLLGLSFNSNLIGQPPQDSVYLYFETEQYDDTIHVYVRTVNFKKIRGFQFAVKYDESIFDITEFYYNSRIGSPLTLNIESGKLFYIWIDPDAKLSSLINHDYIADFKLIVKDDSSGYCLEFINDLITNDIIEFIGEDNKPLNIKTINLCNSLNYSIIKGKIIADLNDNCQSDIDDKNLEGAVIKIENGGKTYSAISNKNGEYVKFVEPDIYQLSISHPSSLWESCPFNTTIDASDKTKLIKLTNYFNPKLTCPNLEVEIICSRLRICTENYLAINYFNHGTSAANSSYIELKLDPRIQLVTGSLPFVNLGSDTYRFDIGTINALEGGVINITIKTTCNIDELNKSICLEAQIFPNEYCGPTLPFWSKADLKINSRCVNNNVEFTIKNIGKGDMTQELSYAIVEDDLMPNGISRLKLNQNESKIIEVPANGKTIRIITDTIPYHPYKVRYSSAIEACGINNSSKGFINKFSLGDEDPHVDIVCNSLLGSFDPNDKSGTPLGAGIENYIQESDRIQYLIRFQNTGTDTAFKVEVVDTISENLDLASLRIVGASHPFAWNNREDRILRFNFYPIKLVDSATNEKESNGFILFSIKPKENIVTKTKIYNHAEIYFDLNPPIKTNTTMHSIGEPITIINNLNSKISIKLFPNPTYDKVLIEFKEPMKDVEIELSDLFGRTIIQAPLTKTANEITFPCTMPTGHYYYKIIRNKQAINSGIIIKNK